MVDCGEGERIMNQRTCAVTGDVGENVAAQREEDGSAPELAPQGIHSWFGVSYANYLVLPRAVLQSMPKPWQHRFTALLEEKDAAFGHLEWPSYSVKVLQREPELIVDYENCGCGGDDPECELCVDGLIADEVRYETEEEVGYREDPIPDYDRGRTRLERARDGADEERSN
jgi:hypothetical protein